MNDKQIILKLKAHKKLVESTYDSMNKNLSLLEREFNALAEPVERHRKQLIEINPDLYGDFIPKTYYDANSSDGYYYSWSLKVICDNIQYLIDISSEETNIHPNDFKITTEGIYFSGQYFDAFLKVAEILKNANSEIILIDGYINESFLKIFSDVNDNVDIKILTKSKSDTISVQKAVATFNQQFANKKKISIKLSEDFHDRFLIIDKREFYHFGASFKDLGNKGFMFSKIEESLIQKSLLQDFNSKW